MLVTFLGTGTSHGVPIVGCNCETCTSNNPKNQRYRSSIYVQTETGASILIDTPPELRLQLLRSNVTRVDAVLFTHAHADHIMGFDDIRALNRLQEEVISCYGNKDTINSIHQAFNYIFNYVQKGGGIPRVELHKIAPLKPFFISGQSILPLPAKHGKLDVLGYKIGALAYITDCSFIPGSTTEVLQEIKVLIIDALRFKKHPTHMNIEQALKFIEKVGVKRAYLTHISHEIEHDKVSKILPDGVKLSYDDLKIEINENSKK